MRLLFITIFVPALISCLPAGRYISEKAIIDGYNGAIESLEEPYVEKIKENKKGYLKKAQQATCPTSAGGFTLITDNIPANLAAQACASLGLQLANVNLANLITVNAILIACLSANAQINSFNGFSAGAGLCTFVNLGGIVDILGGTLGCSLLSGRVLCQAIAATTTVTTTTVTSTQNTITVTVSSATTSTSISGSVSISVLSINVTIPFIETTTDVTTETIPTTITVIDPTTITTVISTGTQIITTTVISSVTTVVISTSTRTKTKTVKPTSTTSTCITTTHCHQCNRRDHHHHHQHHVKQHCFGRNCRSSESKSSNLNKSIDVEEEAERCPNNNCNLSSSSSSSSSNLDSSSSSEDNHRNHHKPDQGHNHHQQKPENNNNHQHHVIDHNHHQHGHCNNLEHLRTCPCKPDRKTDMVVVRNDLSFKQAKCACEELGMELAQVNSNNWVTVSRLALKCAGPIETAWIGSWNGDSYNDACLVFHTGSKSGSGAITTGDCFLKRPAICQKTPRKQLRPHFKGSCINHEMQVPQIPQHLAAQQTCTVTISGLAAVTSLGLATASNAACSLLGPNFVPADINSLNLDAAFSVMSSCGIFVGAYIHAFNNQGSSGCIFLQSLLGGLEVIHIANNVLSGLLGCNNLLGFLCQTNAQIITSSTGTVVASGSTVTSISTITTLTTTGTLTLSSISSTTTTTTTVTTIIIPVVRTISSISTVTTLTTKDITSSTFTVITGTITERTSSTSTITQALFSTTTQTITEVTCTKTTTTVTLLQFK